MFSPSMWQWAQEHLAAVPEAERCVNEFATRADGTICRDAAEPSGWCRACWAEVAP